MVAARAGGRGGRGARNRADRAAQLGDCAGANDPGRSRRTGTNGFERGVHGCSGWASDERTRGHDGKRRSVHFGGRVGVCGRFSFGCTSCDGRAATESFSSAEALSRADNGVWRS